MFSGEEVSRAVSSRLADAGIIPCDEAEVCISNGFRCAKLAEGVWIKMQLCGETDPDQAVVAIAEYADVLAEAWPAMDVLADRIIGRYYRTHGTPQFRPLRAERADSSSGTTETVRDGDSGDSGDGRPDEEGRRIECDEGRDDKVAEGAPAESEEDGGDEEIVVPTEDDPAEGERQESVPKASDDGDAPEIEPEPPRMEDGRFMPREFPMLLELLRRGKFVCLIGPTGTGKSEMVKDAARILGRNLFVCTAPQMSYDITGFVDAHGRYVRKPFSEAFMDGGICLMDEIDRAGPEALIAMNAPVANSIMYIEGVGQCERHPDFVFVATANTAGTGADQEYVTANQLDASTRDRLIYLRVDYDENIELECAGGDRELVDFAHSWRRACEESGVTNALFTYRGIREFSELAADPMFGPQMAIEMALVKCALPRDTLLVVRKRMDCANRYAEALDSYISGMRESLLR
ncbi:MAG: AAA family ATPase [Thermoplasmata archaeon]|nr:AAA family ATPase [Thermoplasmata archaeon]